MPVPLLFMELIRSRLTPDRRLLMDPASVFPVTEKKSFMARLMINENWAGYVLLAVIFLVGVGVRLYRLDQPLLDYHPTRQLHSALIARGMYYQQTSNVPEWQRQMAINQWHAEGVIEPQVFERLVAFTYELRGGVALQVPRLYASIFWVVGAIFLALLAYDFTGLSGAVLASLFYLAWPYGVTASRSFLPEALMLPLIISAWWAAVHWARRHTWGWALAAGLLAGLAIYIKSVALFFIAPPFMVLVLTRSAKPRLWRDPQVWAMAVLSLVLYAAYLIDGLLIHNTLVEQFSQRFFPGFWVDPAFYLRWISNVSRVIPFELVLLAGLGGLLLRKPYNFMVLAVWAGYIIFGLTLPHQISTHDYYHLPLLAPVALGLAAAGSGLYRELRTIHRLANAAAVAAVVTVLVLYGYQSRNSMKRSDTFQKAQALQAAGLALGHNSSVVALTSDYGEGLAYYGWIRPTVWPTADDQTWQASLGNPSGFTKLYQQLAAGRDYFVVTNPSELDRQPQLKEFLQQNYTLLEPSGGVLIYDLHKPPPPG